MNDDGMVLQLFSMLALYLPSFALELLQLSCKIRGCGQSIKDSSFLGGSQLDSADFSFEVPRSTTFCIRVILTSKNNNEQAFKEGGR